MKYFFFVNISLLVKRPRRSTHPVFECKCPLISNEYSIWVIALVKSFVWYTFFHISTYIIMQAIIQCRHHNREKIPGRLVGRWVGTRQDIMICLSLNSPSITSPLLRSLHIPLDLVFETGKKFQFMALKHGSFQVNVINVFYH